MTSHPQTATERFIRAAVDGGYKLEPSYYESLTDRQVLNCADVLIDPDFWRAAGRSLGWDDSPMDKAMRQLTGTPLWMHKWQAMCPHLAAHPGDVEGYLETIISGKENV